MVQVYLAFQNPVSWSKPGTRVLNQIGYRAEFKNYGVNYFLFIIISNLI